jgi:type II secretion system protein H
MKVQPANVHLSKKRPPLIPSFSRCGGEGARRAVEGDSQGFMAPTHVSIWEVFAFHEPCVCSRRGNEADQLLATRDRSASSRRRLRFMVPMLVSMKWGLPRNSNSFRRGFTLIELMVVLVIIAIMTAVIIPEMRGTFEEALLRSTARKLVNVFSLAYSRAVTVNQLHRVRLDRKTGRYTMERTVREGEEGSGFVPVRDIAGSEGELDTRITIEFRRSEEPPAEGRETQGPVISEEESRNQDTRDVIAFHPDGTADSGELLLRDREGFRLVLRINPTTARVQIIELERE